MHLSWNSFVIVAVLLVIKCVQCSPLPQYNSHEITKQGGAVTSSSRFVYGPEEDVQEYEGIPSKVLTKYDNTHKGLANFINPTPIIDNIKEQDKYGNSGDKLEPFGRALVNGYEAFSNFLNRIVDKPFELTRSVSRTITNKLNDVGAKIVGLA